MKQWKATEKRHAAGVLPSSSLQGRKTCGERRKKGVLVLASVEFDSIGKWGFILSLKITSLIFVS